MPFRLRDDLHWCDCGGRAVFVDLDGDRYFCLAAAANGAFLRLAHDESRADDEERLEALVKSGVLIETCAPAEALRPASIEPVTRDYLDEPGSRADLLHIASALAWELRVGWSLRTRPIARIVEAARQRRLRRSATSGDPRRSLETVVAAANTAAFLTRAHNRCLVRGFAVHAACKSIGVEAKLVFGVIAHPFAAHCWVQLGSAVLVGGFEQARLYTPILLVE